MFSSLYFYVETHAMRFFLPQIKRIKNDFILYEFAKMRLNLVSTLCVDALLCASTDMHYVKKTGMKT